MSSFSLGQRERTEIIRVASIEARLQGGKLGPSLRITDQKGRKHFICAADIGKEQFDQIQPGSTLTIFIAEQVRSFCVDSALQPVA